MSGGWLYDKAMSFSYNGHWDSVQRFTQSFDPHNNVVIRKDEKPMYGWVAGDYRDSFGYYYSAAGKYVICTQLRKKWSTVFSSWQPYELYTCYIDTSLLPQNMLKQTWNNATLLWDNTELETYTYDSHYNVIAKVLYSYNTSTLTWDPVQRTGISYFSPTLYSRIVISKSKAGVWVDSVSTNYNYNSKNEPITATLTQWNITSATWNNSKRYNRTFDANHNILTETTQQWNNNSSGWGNTQRLSQVYDANNNLTATATETWSVSASAWVYDASSAYKRYYYGTYTSSEVPMVNVVQPSFNMYPNPCNGGFTIAIAPQDFVKVAVRVYDAMGRDVYSQIRIPNFIFQINLDVPKGIYFVKLQLDDMTSVKQLVVE